MPNQKITIIRIKKPQKENINEEIKWLGQSLGLFNQRDKDNSQYRIFVEILKNTGKKPQTSDQIAHKLNLTRGTVIHHIKKLKETGIVTNNNNKYELTLDNLETILEQTENEIQTTIKTMKKIAKKIDKKLGF